MKLTLEIPADGENAGIVAVYENDAHSDSIVLENAIAHVIISATAHIHGGIKSLPKLFEGIAESLADYNLSESE